jgi:hypothetical protein
MESQTERKLHELDRLQVGAADLRIHLQKYIIFLGKLLWHLSFSIEQGCFN